MYLRISSIISPIRSVSAPRDWGQEGSFSGSSPLAARVSLVYAAPPFKGVEPIHTQLPTPTHSPRIAGLGDFVKSLVAYFRDSWDRHWHYLVFGASYWIGLYIYRGVV